MSDGSDKNKIADIYIRSKRDRQKYSHVKYRTLFVNFLEHIDKIKCENDSDLFAQMLTKQQMFRIFNGRTAQWPVIL